MTANELAIEASKIVSSAELRAWLVVKRQDSLFAVASSDSEGKSLKIDVRAKGSEKWTVIRSILCCEPYCLNNTTSGIEEENQPAPNDLFRKGEKLTKSLAVPMLCANGGSAGAIVARRTASDAPFLFADLQKLSAFADSVTKNALITPIERVSGILFTNKFVARGEDDFESIVLFADAVLPELARTWLRLKTVESCLESVEDSPGGRYSLYDLLIETKKRYISQSVESVLQLLTDLRSHYVSLAEKNPKNKDIALATDNARRFVHQSKGAAAQISPDVLWRVLEKERETLSQYKDWDKKKMLTVLRGSIDRLKRLHRQLHEFKIAHGWECVYRINKHSSASLVDYCLLHKEQAREFHYDGGVHTVKIRVDNESGTFDYWSDDAKIKEALDALVQNALEEIAEKEKSDPSLAGTGEIAITFAPIEGGGIKVVVADNGRGISPQIAKRARERYFSFGKPYGTGIGLAAVSEIAKRLNGEIEINDRDGAGSEFILSCLPIERSAK
jgi:signal transduction histidine kinase